VLACDRVTAVTVLADGLAHPEGPDLLADGRVIFVETFRGRISAWSSERGLHLFASVTGAPCACMVGADGVYVTQSGAEIADWRSPEPAVPSIQKVTPAGEVVVVTDRADGYPLRAPNDLTFGADGRLYFTDPGRYDPVHPEDGRVCVVELDGSTHTLVEVGPTYPNGITTAGDGAVIWVESYTRHVWRWRPDGALALVTTLPDGHIPDGLKVGADDHLYIASVTSGGVDVISPAGEVVRFIETGGEPQNCVFDGTDLIVADFGELPQDGDGGLASGPACGRLLRVPAGVAGRPLVRGAIG
jgi:gluconolactonase